MNPNIHYRNLSQNDIFNNSMMFWSYPPLNALMKVLSPRNGVFLSQNDKYGYNLFNSPKPFQFILCTIGINLKNFALYATNVFVWNPLII